MKQRFWAITALALALSMFFATAAFAQGWGKTGTSWFYYPEDGTVARNTWIETEGGPYWVNGDGAMATSQWVNDGSAWYYVGSDGRKLTSQIMKLNGETFWLGEWKCTEDGKWYYLQSNGYAMRNGWKMVNGEYYYFLKSGIMAADALVPGGYRVGADGRWVQ